ncbi:MAG TPA: chemotaxis protein CheC [Ruminiclostridium sp.]|nr:chemotaxis protein CheC [Ruminiclostridium sp.]
MLSEIQKDLLSEILNTNLGVAASLLSEMVSQKVILSLPALDLKKGNEIDLKPLSTDSEFNTSVLCSMRFGNNFSGNAYIVIPVDKAKFLVDACLEEDNADGDYYSKLTAQDLDVIKEISNIIFNAVIGGFGNLLDVRLEYTLPQIEMTAINSMDGGILPEDMHFLSMFNSFYLPRSQVRGMIFIALSVSSENMLINKINEMLVDIND